jgi:peptide/nickel transport system substrate-binding protein
MKRLAGFVLWLAFGLVILLAACSGPDRDEGVVAVRHGQDVPAYGDILVEGSIGDASNLIPVLATDNASHSSRVSSSTVS